MCDLTPAVDSATAGESAERTVDEALAQGLVERARTEGVELVGPGGLLTGLTKTVLETALEAELDEHLGSPRHAVVGRKDGQLAQRLEREEGAERGRRGRARAGRATGTAALSRRSCASGSGG